MGRPLSKQQLFGANSGNNIKVQFYNGSASVPGYIVKQTGSKRFVCSDADGNTATCYLVDKASAALGAGEMTITLKYDDATVQQATKIARHRVTLDYDSSVQSMPWNFSTSTTDGAWQIEEAGTNTSLASSTDLESDDFVGDRDYPTPGSGTYVASASITASYSAWGTPAAATGSVTTVSNSASGLYRTKWMGLALGTTNGLPSQWDMTFPTGYQFVKSSVDTYGGFGTQPDIAPNTNFSLEWTGYIQLPSSQAWNFAVDVDDDVGVWIGSDALAPTNSNWHVRGAGVTQDVTAHATNGLTFNSTKWYPIRIRFTEHNGNCNMQLFAIGADGTKLNGADLTWAYNTATNGF